jgi:uncharacterized membrane protein
MLQVQQFSGPMPPPEVLAEYDRIIPGAAERILAMAEANGSQRRALENRTLETNRLLALTGQWLAFAIAMTAIAGGIWLASRGQSLEGLTSLLAALGSLLVVFFVDRADRQREEHPRR